MSSSDRKRYLTATSLTQEFLDDTHDNLINKLEMVVEIGEGVDTIRASDRNKYVGEHFYEAILKIPDVNRTIGEWLSPTLEFSTIKLTLGNVDGRFNTRLPAGATYDGWLQQKVVVKIGLRDVESSYDTVFKGFVSEIAGLQRNTNTVQIVARDSFSKLDEKFPTGSFTLSAYPDLESAYIGKIKPLVYGDWTTDLFPESDASIPCTPLNGHHVDTINGNNYLKLYISDNANTFFDNTHVILERSSKFYGFDSSDVLNISVGNNYFELKQINTGGITSVDGAAYTYRSGDKFYVKVRGKDLGGYDDNIVAQAKDILLNNTTAVAGDFDANWETFRDKSSPAQSNIASFKSRAHIARPEKGITYALSMLEQVRLEAFIDRDLKIKINSLHFEDFPATPSFTVRNWDIGKGTFNPKIDARNNFNRAQAFYNRLPNINENFYNSNYFNNAASITLANGKAITKGVVFPNLYEDAAVQYQLIEILRLASTYFEIIDYTATWRSFLLEPGEFVSIDVSIGSTVFESSPAMVRSIGYNPSGMKVPMKLWSFQMTPYPGYEPGYFNTVGGYDAAITEET